MTCREGAIDGGALRFIGSVLFSRDRDVGSAVRPAVPSPRDGMGPPRDRAAERNRRRSSERNGVVGDLEMSGV